MEDEQQVITLRIPYMVGLPETPAAGSSAEIIIADVHLWKLKKNGLALAYPLEQRIRELEGAANALLNQLCNEPGDAAAMLQKWSHLRSVVDKSLDSYDKNQPPAVDATYEMRSAPIGGVAGEPPPPSTDSILTWIKGLVAAAELAEQYEMERFPASKKSSVYPYDPPNLWGTEPQAALATARKLGWVGGKIGNLPALVSTEKQKPKSISFSSAPGVPTDPPSAGPGPLGHRGTEGPAGVGGLHGTFLYELQQLINKHSLENQSNTPADQYAERWSPPNLRPLNLPSGLVGAVNDLYSFHGKMDVPWITDEPTWPGLARVKLRRELVDEECDRELAQSLNKLELFAASFGAEHLSFTQRRFANGDDAQNEFRRLMSDVADGIVDSIYVLIGMGGEMGLDLSEVWRRVHVANMAKAGGPVREDGKRLKPEGWTPPDVEGAIFKTP